MLLKVLLWGYMNGVRSSRKLADKLGSDVVFMWLAGLERPDFRTICLFRRTNMRAINDLFAQVVQIANGLGLVRLGLVALDGTKMHASAGMSSFKKASAWRKELEETKKRVREILEEAEALDRADDERYGSDRHGDELPEGLEEAQKRVKRIEKLLGELEEGGKDNTDTRMSMTDPEARFMHRLGGPVPAYNAQVAVTEDQFIVYADVTQEPTDVNQLLPALDGIRGVCGEMPERVVADAGYTGGRNLAGLDEREVDGYIPEGSERDIGKRKRRRHPELYGREVFSYDRERDCYICPGGKELVPRARHRVKVKYSKRELRIYRAERGACLACEQKARCTMTSNPLGRAVSRDSYEGERARMRQKLATEDGRRIYAQRKWLVEPVVGQIRVVENFIQFLLRGLERVRVEWKWAAIAHNMLKIIRKVGAGEIQWAPVP
jgi:transposase